MPLADLDQHYTEHPNLYFMQDQIKEHIQHTRRLMKKLLEDLIISKCDGEICENLGFAIIAFFCTAVIWHSLSII